MKNQIEIVKEIADGMIGIGGIPTNEEFYAEFDMRVRAALRIQYVVGQSEQLKALEDLKQWCFETCQPLEEERLHEILERL